MLLLLLAVLLLLLTLTVAALPASDTATCRKHISTSLETWIALSAVIHRYL
jgi:hypothetical protein